MHSVEPTRGIRPARPSVRRALRFAPVSGEHSSALRIAMGYFTLTGALTLLGGTIGIGAGVASGVAASAPLAFALGSATIVATGIGALWTGRLLEHRRRLGGAVAIATLVTPVVQWMLGSGPPSGVLFSLAGAAIMVSVWNELD